MDQNPAYTYTFRYMSGRMIVGSDSSFNLLWNLHTHFHNGCCGGCLVNLTHLGSVNLR